MIQLESISKRFGGVRALQNVSMQLRPGEVHCLAGENGSGKSTLIKVLAGVLRPDCGTIIMGDQRTGHLTPIDSVRRGIQVIYQDFSLFPNLTVAENLALNCQLEHREWWVNRRRMWQTARQAMDRLGITLPLDASVEQLPVAQKQLVAIARALVQDTRLIVLDEPTTALTHIEVDALFEILRNLRARGVAILFVSHQLREMQRIGDHYTILRGGQVVASGPADQFDLGRITRTMTGRSIVDKQQAADKPATGQTLLEVTQLMNETLYGVSLRLYVGERLGLTGLLGSGQTALALALFGLQPVSSGQILWQGQPLSIRSVQDAIDARIAYVPEDRLTEGLFLDQSIERNIIAAHLQSVQGKLGLLAPSRVRRYAQHWRDALTLAAPDVSAPVRSLSGGNQQRVVLAKWLSRKPKLLILNGPTVGVDIGSKEGIHEKLRQLAAEGTSVLMISDDLAELARHTDRVLIMHRGRIVYELAGDNLSEQKINDHLSRLE
jgi:simple sugar transport system ATP-binding protein